MKFTSRLASSSVILAVLLMLVAPALDVSAGAQLQGAESAWVVWETRSPIQRVAWDGGAIWAGAYKGGLSQWQLQAGQVSGYTSADGLSGDHVTGIAVDGSGQKWLALLDGSLNSTVDGNTFTNLTPEGAAGKNAWDLAASGDEVWLASLGGGVSRYSNGTWTNYNTSNSALPHNDVYAVAVDTSGMPWVGTVNYGVVALQNGAWVSYTLPVQVENPVSPGAYVSNQAVTDIAVDPAGNKWFATDGSGVAVLDASNANWTVYDTSNSGLGSNFVHRIYFDSQGNIWFGTLSGGVSRLSADRTTWLTYNTGNSPLPEDDILDMATDSQGGLWLAAYDSGLAYYGPLPAAPPTFELDLFGKPDYLPGKVTGYYLWVDPDTYVWTLAWSGGGANHTFSGEILADSTLTYLSSASLEAGDSAVVDDNRLIIEASEGGGEDAVTFKPAWDVSELTVRLKIDGAYYPYRIHLGGMGATPATAPFRVAAVQPLPPQVTAPEGMTVDEGDYVFLNGQLSDPDSPTGHTIVWNLGDGNLVEDELSVSHVYQDNGAFTAQLTVTDVHGRVGTDLLNITVQNVAPDADFYYQPFTPNARQTVTFTGFFYDPSQADTHTLTWDFGDGSAPVTTQELEVTHAYQQAGVYEITMTVTDDDGGQGIATATLEVINEPPQLTLAETATVDEGAPLAQNVNFSDPDSTRWQVDVNYGDGSAPVQFILDEVAEFELDHSYADNGEYTLTLTITDDGGASATGEMLVTVQNVAPLLEHEAEITLTEGDTLVKALSIIDPGADTWSVTINYGDGAEIESLSLSERDFELNHLYVDNGAYAVDLCVTDDDGGEGCSTFTARVLNANPVVVAGEDQSIEEGDAVTATAQYTDAGALDTHTGKIDWGDGVVEDVVIEASGTISGTHTYHDDGEFVVQLCVIDNNGGQGCDSLLVSASNVAPIFEAGPDRNVEEGTEVSLPEAAFSDKGASDEHTATIDWGDGTVESASVQYTEAGLGTVMSAHRYGDEGLYAVSIELCDDDGACVQDGFNVTVTNAAPVVSATTSAINEGERAIVQIEYVDPGFLDTHTMNIDWGDGSPPEAVDIRENTGSGSFAVEHVYGDNGSYEVTATVTDDDGQAGVAAATVDVANLSPELTVDDPETVLLPDGEVTLGRAGMPQTYQFSMTDPGSDDLTITWSPGLDLTYYNDGAGPDPLPSPAGIFPFTVSGSAELTFEQPGIYTLGATAADDDGASSTVTLPQVVVVGDQACPNPTGWWKHQFNENGQPHIDAQTLQAYLDIVNVSSAFFSEQVPVNTIEEGREIMRPDKPNDRERATQELLVAWLNYAQGSVGWDEPITFDKKEPAVPFWQLMAEAEAILADENASKKDLDYAEKLAKAVSTSAADHPNCNKADTSSKLVSAPELIQIGILGKQRRAFAYLPVIRQITWIDYKE